MRAISIIFTAAVFLGGSVAIATAKSAPGASGSTPGHAMQSKGPAGTDPGASGYSPGDKMNDKGATASDPGASGYSPGDKMNDARKHKHHRS